MTRTRRIALTAVAAAAACLAVVGALWVTADVRAAQSARRLWESKEPAAYSFEYSHCGGMCALCQLRVTVERGKVTHAAGISGQCSAYDLERAPTIESVFAAVEGERSAPRTDSIEIRYDRHWGFPAAVDVQCPPHTSDCGASYRVTGFRVLR